MVYREVYGFDLPDYSDTYAHADNLAEVAVAVAEGLSDGWA
jgi:hypothetical protein